MVNIHNIFNNVLLYVLILRNKLPKNITNFLKYYSLYLSIIMIGGYFFVEIIPVKIIVTLIPYRSLVFFTLIYLLIYSYYMYYKFQNKEYISFLMLHAPFIPIITKDLILSTAGLLIAFIYSVVSDILLNKNIRIRVYIDDFLFNKLKLKTFYFVLILVAIFGSYFGLGKNFALDIPEINSSENEVYLWLKENTSQDAVILSEINVDDLVNQKIRILADRAVPISEDFSFNEKYYREWEERYVEIYDGEYENKGFLDEKTSDQLYQLSQKYDVNYILRTKEIDNSVSSSFILKETLDINEKKIYIYSRNIIEII